MRLCRPVLCMLAAAWIAATAGVVRAEARALSEMILDFARKVQVRP